MTSMPIATNIDEEAIERLDRRVRRHPFGYWEIADKPSAEELQKFYSEHYFQAQEAFYRPAYPPEERSFIQAKIQQAWAQVRAIRGEASGQFLDVGCGEGFALAFFQKMGWQCEGLDYSVAGLENHHPELLDVVSTGDLSVLLAERIQAGMRYDLVWLSHVLEHSPDPPGLLTGIQGILSDSGVLVVKVPNDFSAFQMNLVHAGHIDRPFWVGPPAHLAYFDRESLEQAAAACGLRCREVLADFPIDWFLMHPASNYIRDRAQGNAAHQARILFENSLNELPPARVNAFYAAMASVGLGRTLTGFFTRD
jgi:2-polyprenyl-3-methyl-5-hydroxy-6-metoxy-1,4-benzoquinol methylase